jgi:hypothetical protein
MKAQYEKRLFNYDLKDELVLDIGKYDFVGKREFRMYEARK